MSHAIVDVLLIEDNPDQVVFLRQLLGNSDALIEFRLHTAGTLADGLAFLASQAFELILLDLSLPDSSGLETFVRVAEVATEVAIVVLSGTDDVVLAVETVQLGAQDYLVKGHLDNHLLIRSMQYAVERKRGQLQLRRAYDELESRVKERTGMLQQANARLQKEIAERKRAEEETLESNRQLASALGQLHVTRLQSSEHSRMNELASLAGDLLNDFNDALLPVLASCELLLSDSQILANPLKVENYVQLIQRSAMESAAVVERLREFQNRQPQEEESGVVALNALVEQVIVSNGLRAGHDERISTSRIDVKTEFSSVPALAGSKAEWRNALQGLLSNALEAIPAQGTISIRTGLCADHLLLSFTDDGIGMSDEFKARLLEPGHGSGLDGVHSLIDRYNGEIHIESEPGNGSTVTISLPLDGKENPEVLTQLPPVAAPQCLRILVVDDEPLVREVIAIYLGEDNHIITTACNGREGLEKFNADNFDVVLTDRAMPEMNGEQLAFEIKQRNPKQPVILLTGFGESAGDEPMGVDLVVSKPFTMNTLRSAISRCLAV
ncbi:MAG: Histidine kinase [Chthoniobacteraceae bacterium]|nr:Histidine kinase [Chthoniobacteraceae bacterium]